MSPENRPRLVHAEDPPGGELEISPTFSEDDLALRFTARHGDDLRFIAAWGAWFRWDGARWQRDKTLRAFDFARKVCRDAAGEIMTDPTLKKSPSPITSAKTVAAVVSLAKSDRRHAAQTEDWDRDQWLLNTPGGTVALHDGVLRPHDRADLITKIIAVAPGGRCPLWLKFLHRAFAGDQALIDFVQRMAGYCLTGSIREHALFFLHGTGANGKGVFLNTLRGILAEYATVAPITTFVASRTEQHPTDLAALRGARAVIAQETEEGQRWAEAKIKALTGGDPLTARFVRQDFFTFEPSFKLIIAGNHRPALRAVDEAVRRRFNLVPFRTVIPPAERDQSLPEKLKAEWPGILSWMIEGCLEWQRMGLAQPPAVTTATEAYLAAEDAIGRFIDERCELTGQGDPHLQSVADLFASWQDWCSTTGEYAGSAKRFSQSLEDRGLERQRHPKTRRKCFAGLRLVVFAPDAGRKS